MLQVPSPGPAQTLWEQLLPTVVSVLALVLSAAGAAVVAWIRRKQAQWEVAKAATVKAEQISSEFMGGLTGDAKLAVALHQVERKAPWYARMSREKAKDVIEHALRESSPGVPIEPPPPAQRPSKPPNAA